MGTKWFPLCIVSVSLLVLSVPPSSADTYTASTDFSSVQGYRNWTYLNSDGSPMTYDAANSRWQGKEQFLLVGPTWAHPGMSYDAVRRWTAPQAGSVRITGNASDSQTGCGTDGVIVSIRKGSTLLWQQTIAKDNTTGFPFDLSTAVAAGTVLDFVINKGVDNSCDGTEFDPTIVFTPGGSLTSGGVVPSVGAPTLVVQTSQVNNRAIDAPITTISHGSAHYWINSTHWFTSKYQGTVDQPFQTLLWTRSTDQVFGGPPQPRPDGSIPYYWIQNTYQDPAGVLAFIHNENSKNGTHAYDRVGLAWSVDYGEHFKYLGDIIIPYTDPNMNIQGIPYIMKDSYFYIYFKDACGGSVLSGGDAAARAPVVDVINAAKAGTVSPWKKYLNGSWESSGLGGNCTKINLPVGFLSVDSTDSAYSSYSGKYYLTMSANTEGPQDSWIKLYESSDGINWIYDATIVEQSPSTAGYGYQYVSIVDPSGSDNGVVGQQFYVYSAKFPAQSPFLASNPVVYRWTVNLVPPPPGCLGDRDLVGYWKLDGNLNDECGLHSGTASNVTWPPGHLGASVGLSGSTSYGQVPDGPNMDGIPAFTLAAWVKLTNLTSVQIVLNKSWAYRLIIEGATLKAVVGTLYNSWYTDATIATCSTALQGQTWQHVAATYDGTYVKVYLNGSLCGTSPSPISGNIIKFSDPMTLSDRDGAYPLAGSVDEVRLYKRALTASEIAALAANDGGGSDTTPPTVSISAPANGATVSGSVTITASASDNVGVTKVEFYVDGALKATDTASPYSYAWNTTSVANGSHTLQAKAYDAAGNIGQSSAVSVMVSNTTTLLGDLNGDGQRTLTDVRWLIEMLVGLRVKNLTTADLTGDGQLSLADLQALIRLLVGGGVF